MCHLAQARGAYLSENSWEPDVFRCSGSLGERPQLLGEEQSRLDEEVSPKQELANPIALSVGNLA